MGLQHDDPFVVPQAPIHSIDMERRMKRLLELLMRVIGTRPPNADERFLAQSVDAHDFETRAQVLERRRG